MVPSEAFHPHYYAGESRVYAYTPIITAASSAVKPFDIESVGGPMGLPHDAGTAGVEAPRQRRAQRAEGKRLRGVAPVVALTSAAPEGRAAGHLQRP
jgi:hypothetical protein